MFSQTFHLNTPAKTQQLAQLLSKHCQLPAVFLLFGPIGIGKTQFVKFFANFLGIKSVNSPSFIKMNIYLLQQKRQLVHFDGFQLDEQSDLNQFLDYFDADYLFLEWPERISQYFAPNQTISLFWSWNQQRERVVTVKSYYKIFPDFQH